MLSVGSLFSGIGGFDLGLERAGMRTLWFCEQDPFCQRVLAKHWPGVPCHGDVCALVADPGGERRRKGPGIVGGVRTARCGEGQGAVPVPVPHVDVLCGGFPCQDISFAGAGGGIAGGDRSGLWREFARLIGELRPRYVVVENVPAITSRGLDIVLADLAACGFDAEWDHLPASAFGAPHRRDRFWLVAYPDGQGEPDGSVDARSGTRFMGDTESDGRRSGWERRSVGSGADGDGFAAQGMADASRDAAAGSGEETGADRERAREGSQRSGTGGNWWLVEPDVRRVAHGVPARVDRLRSLGNALVPQIAEWIGSRIVAYERERVVSCGTVHWSTA